MTPHSVKEALTDREQWTLFFGHLVLGLIVLWPIVYFSTSAIAAEEAKEAATVVELKVDEVSKAVTSIQQKQTSVSSDIDHIKSDLMRLQSGQDKIEQKIDKLIDRELDGKGK